MSTTPDRRDASDTTEYLFGPAGGPASYGGGADDPPQLATEHHRQLLAAQAATHGGMKLGSAFFGWLTTVGMAVLLTSLLALVATVVGLSTDTTPADVEVSATGSDAGTAVVVGAVALGAVVVGSYFCGGYVAARMARFDGAKQGVAVWLWSLVMAVLLGVLGAVLVSRVTIPSELDTARWPTVELGALGAGPVVVAVGGALLSLLGAVLGGMAGMRYHRAVDRTGLVR